MGKDKIVLVKYNDDVAPLEVKKGSQQKEPPPPERKSEPQSQDEEFHPDSSPSQDPTVFEKLKSDYLRQSRWFDEWDSLKGSRLV